MSDNRKYYYLKLKDDFFESDSMILLENMKDGYLYSNILLKLYLKSLKDAGRLMLNGRIPYNSQMIASVTRHQVGTVEKALNIFEDLGLIELLDNGAIYMLDIQNFIGESSTEADRKREYRARIETERAGQKDGQMSAKMSGQNSLDIRDRDKDKDKDRDRNSIICPEPKLSPDKSGILLPLNGGSLYDVPLSKIEEWSAAFPAVDVKQELLKMITWLNSNPERRKTSRGINRFINTWLSKEQDKGGRFKAGSSPQTAEPIEVPDYVKNIKIFRRLRTIRFSKGGYDCVILIF